jgi:NAD-dependent SIR2 family protein deacetylase
VDESVNRNVYILGAGFSADAGAPMIHNFLDRARELYEDPTSSLDAEGRKQFTSVFDFRRRMAQSREKVRVDLDNIEQLFGLVEMSVRLGNTDLQTMRDATVYLIAKTLELTTANRTERSKIVFDQNADLYRSDTQFPVTFVPGQPTPGPQTTYKADLYDAFTALLAGFLDDPKRRAHRRSTIITFNYDLILDDCLRRISIEPAYFLEPDAQMEESEQRIPLLKLHGSINWGICACCRNLKVVASPADFRGDHCPKCRQVYQPLLIPPSWDKSGHRDVVQHVWKRAIRDLKEASRICIIGYSMPRTDAFFQYLLTLALADNHQLHKLVVVDLGNAVERKYIKLLDHVFQQRRFKYCTGGLKGFLSKSNEHNELLARGELLTPRSYD